MHTATWGAAGEASAVRLLRFPAMLFLRRQLNRSLQSKQTATMLFLAKAVKSRSFHCLFCFPREFTAYRSGRAFSICTTGSRSARQRSFSLLTLLCDRVSFLWQILLNSSFPEYGSLGKLPVEGPLWRRSRSVQPMLAGYCESETWFQRAGLVF